MNQAIVTARTQALRVAKEGYFIAFTAVALALAAAVGFGALPGSNSSKPAAPITAPASSAPDSAAIASSGRAQSAPLVNPSHSITYYLVDSEESAAYMRSRDAELGNLDAGSEVYFRVAPTLAERAMLVLELPYGNPNVHVIDLVRP